MRLNKTLQVILVIAVVCTLVEIGALVVNLLEPPRFSGDPAVSNRAARAELRWQVYWFGGLPVALAGLACLRRFDLAGNALLIGGVYLMLFGNNGGFWAEGHVEPRLATSALTLGLLLFLIRNQRWSDPPPD